MCENFRSPWIIWHLWLQHKRVLFLPVLGLVCHPGNGLSPEINSKTYRSLGFHLAKTAAMFQNMSHHRVWHIRPLNIEMCDIMLIFCILFCVHWVNLCTCIYVCVCLCLYVYCNVVIQHLHIKQFNKLDFRLIDWVKGVIFAKFF